MIKDSELKIEKVIVRDDYKIYVPMTIETEPISVLNRSDETIYFAFPIDREGLFVVKPGEKKEIIGTDGVETEFIRLCALKGKYTCINKIVVVERG